MSTPGDPPSSRPPWGDYRLGAQLSEGARTRTFRAEQITVRREVILEQLKPEAAADPQAVEAFFADVRAKAAVHHRGIGSVYEALHEDGRIFYTREQLPGEHLEDLHVAGSRFPPPVLLDILRQAAEAMAYLEAHGTATLPIEPRHLVLGPHQVLRIVNLAISDDPDPRVALHDRHLLAELLLDCVEEGLPGATRTTDILHELGSDRVEAPDWNAVALSAANLIADLERGRAAVSPPVGTPAPARRGPGTLLVLAGILVAALVIIGGGVLLVLRNEGSAVRPLDGMVSIPGGASPATPPFLIDTEEVTIAEYTKFLAALAVIDPAHRDAYDHPDQPATKEGHEPEGWEAIYAAARSGGTWEGLAMNLNCPVMNVDWWDAYAFADWRGGRLPTETEWAAAAQGAEPVPSGWGVVDASPDDRTPGGVVGLGGNVSEWVREPSRNPAFPMNPKKPVACGASYHDPANGIRARLWLPSRTARRPDLGFRVLRESPRNGGD